METRICFEGKELWALRSTIFRGGKPIPVAVLHSTFGMDKDEALTFKYKLQELQDATTR